MNNQEKLATKKAKHRTKINKTKNTKTENKDNENHQLFCIVA
jgi:hypothetical protein